MPYDYDLEKFKEKAVADAISIFPLPLGTFIFCLQVGHLNTLCVFFKFHIRFFLSNQFRKA